MFMVHDIFYYFPEIINKVNVRIRMYVHQEENGAFVLILLSFSRCDNIVLFQMAFFIITLK